MVDLKKRRSRRVRKRPATSEQIKLINLRVKFGADTPRGHACSNLFEQLENYKTAAPDVRAKLAKLIPAQMARLSNSR